MSVARADQAVVLDASTAPGSRPSTRNGSSGVTPVPESGASTAGRPSGPVVVEFAGTPRAGKTSAMHALSQRLRRGRRVVHLVEERAHLSPVPSSEHPQFNLWTATTTTSMMIQAMYSEADVVLVDRGLFDSLCWLDWYRRSKRLNRPDSDVIERFLCVTPLRQLTDLVLVMTVDPSRAMEREQSTWSHGTAGSSGTIMNIGTLRQLNASIAATVHRHSDKFTLRQLDTTLMDPGMVFDSVAELVGTVMDTATRSSAQRRT